MLRKNLIVATFMAISAIATAQTEAIEKANKNFQLANFGEAARAYEKILPTLRDTFGMTERLADCYFHLAQFDLAEKWYIKALEKEETSVEALYRAGEVSKILGNMSDAQHFWEAYANFQRKKADYFLSSLKFVKAGIESSNYVVTPSQYNTENAEFGASILRGDVVFASERTDLKRKSSTNATADGTTANQLFIAPLEGLPNAPKSGVQFLKSDFKNTLNEAPAAYSGNGKWVVFSRNNFQDGIRPLSTSGLELSLYVARVNDRGDWMDIKPFPHNVSGYASGFPTLNEDGTILYFASNRPQGKGGFDIWVSVRKNDVWSKPINVEGINTIGDEITPFFDGNTLFFASDYWTGFGGFDIFKAEQNANGGFSEAKNMGKGINSSADDYGFVMSKSKIGYLISNRKGSKGKTDLYKVTSKTTVLTIRAQDATKKAVPLAQKEVKLLANKGVLTVLKDGNLAFAFEGSEEVKMTIQKQGFENQVVSLRPSMPSPVEVTLKKVGEKEQQNLTPTEGGYVGYVKDSLTNKALAGVTVRAVHQKNSTMLETITDAQGKYVLPLEKNLPYALSYSKELFLNTSRSFKTTAANRGNIQDVLMQPSPTAIRNEENKPKPQEPTPPIKPEKTVVKGEGWAIQLSVQTKDNKKIDMTPYKEVRSLGNFYTSEEGNKVKIRLGVYKTRKDAERMLKSVQNKGFKSAYIVEETDAEVIKNQAIKPTKTAQIVNEIDPNKVKQEPLNNATTPTPPKPTPPSVPEVKSEGWAIQLVIQAKDGKKIDFAPYKDISALGNFYSLVEGNKVKIRLGVYKVRKDAENILKSIQNKGYKTAYIVEEINPEAVKDNTFSIKGGVLNKIEAREKEGIKVKDEPEKPRPTDYNAPIKPQTAEGTADTKPYKVRVASLSRPDKFDKSKITSFGAIKMVKQGKWTWVLVDGFKTLEEARTIRLQLKEAGYKDGRVVLADKNGVFKEVD